MRFFTFSRKKSEEKQKQEKERIDALVKDCVAKYFEENLAELAIKVKAKHVELVKDSEEPYVNILSDAYDEQNGSFKLILDWNDAFIKQLRKAGYTGATDQEMVNLWLASLSREMQ
jgi:hypothetical protein